MLRRLVFCTLLLSVVRADEPSGASQGSRGISFDAAISQAVSRNLDLQAARLEIARASGRRLQAGRLPNPEVELSGKSERAISKGQGSTLGIDLSQGFPVTNRLALSRQIAELDVVKAQAEVRNRERVIAGETAKAYIEAVRAKARLFQAREAAKLAGESTRAIESRFRGGQLAQADAGLAELEVQRLEAEVEVLIGEEEAARARLREKLGLAPGSVVTLSETLNSLIARLGARSSGLIARADLTALGTAQESARLEQELSRSEALGDWKLTLSFEATRRIEGTEGYVRERELGLRLSIPLPVWNRNEGRVAELVAAEHQFAREATARRRQIAGVQEEAQARIAGLRRSVELYRSRSFPLLRRTEESLLEAFNTGGRDLTQLFLVRREHNAVHQAEINALAEIALQLAEAEVQRGTHPSLHQRLSVASKKSARP